MPKLNWNFTIILLQIVCDKLDKEKYKKNSRSTRAIFFFAWNWTWEFRDVLRITCRLLCVRFRHLSFGLPTAVLRKNPKLRNEKMLEWFQWNSLHFSSCFFFFFVKCFQQLCCCVDGRLMLSHRLNARICLSSAKKKTVSSRVGARLKLYVRCVCFMMPQISISSLSFISHSILHHAFLRFSLSDIFFLFFVLSFLKPSTTTQVSLRRHVRTHCRFDRLFRFIFLVALLFCVP